MKTLISYKAQFVLVPFKCQQCFYEWIPSYTTIAELPKFCPKCKSYLWNRPPALKRAGCTPTTMI